MTQDEIIEMAKQVGMIKDGEWWFSSFYKTEQDVHISHLEDFANLVAQHEREALYSIVMDAPFRNMEQDEFDSEIGTAMKAMAFDITSAIRKRGQA